MSKPMSVGAKRNGKCLFCGKPMQRTRRFSVNPMADYNKSLREAQEKAAAWEPDPEVWRHPKCLAIQQIPGQTDIYDVLES